MNSVELHGQYLYHDGVKNETNPEAFFDPMEEKQAGCRGGRAATSPCGSGEGGREIWTDHQRDQEEDLLDVNDPFFYSYFPSLPDFPCMSSSSSSSSSHTPAPVKANTPSSSSSSSSATSWAVLKSEAEEDAERRNYLDHDHYNYSNHNNNSCAYYDDQGQPLSTAPSLSSIASMEMPHDHLRQPQLQASNHHREHQVVEGVDCMDVMESFGYMDLLENNDFFDPSSVFNPDEDNNALEELQYQQQVEKKSSDQKGQQVVFSINDESILQDTKSDGTEHLGGGSCAKEDLAKVFLDWLKNNKETVSAEDLRRVKIKKSTIECAARRLGGGKEAVKQLLKLILEWVQTNHLQKRRLMMSRELPSSTNSNNTNTTSALPNYQYQQDPIVLQSPNPSSSPPTSNPTLNCTFSQPDESHLSPHQPYVPAETLFTGLPPMTVYMGDLFGNGSACNINYPPNRVDYHMLGSSHAPWAPPSGFGLAPNYASFPKSNLPLGPPPPRSNPPFTGFGNRYPCHHPYLQGQDGCGGSGADNGMPKLGLSATKEARKKRMARQRRFLSHHRNHHNYNHLNQQYPNLAIEPHTRLGNDSGNGALDVGQSNPGNWLYWPPNGANSTSTVLPGDVPLDMSTPMQGQNFQRQVASDKPQGPKSEKNLKLLLQKVLKQSDVGNLGRIVLPKKEAETHLPELEARDGISIAMEDIGTSRVWNMRYRFWPNNKSRMYLLENTGDFVTTNGLQEGDFIVIYSDIKCGKYLIRGVKVRQQGQKLENKRPGKSQRIGHANSPGTVNSGVIGSPPTPTNQTVH